MEALAMVIGSAVAYLVLSGRKEREWEEELDLSRGLNIVRMFKDPEYNITPKNRQNTKVAVKHAVKINKRALLDGMPKSATLIIVDSAGRAYAGKFGGIEYERRGLILKRDVPKIKVRTAKQGRPVVREYDDIQEVYIKLMKSTEHVANEWRKDKFYYAAIVAKKKGTYPFKIKRG
ncbi:hypothetical protein E3E38_03900 [Thermococcus sp. 18S1]|uniref:hypothetical protein n=1 Tax=unclassified Thermococcus TaxID=2627626 RepID=UPI000AFE67CE|nr:hypothetical protein [Thermococcus sp. 4557]NJE30195.1 hypothetical protein [Thermococcus sp. 18S1]